LTSEEVARFFDLEQRLGRRDVNDIIAAMLKRSARPLAAQVRTAAETLLAALRKNRSRAATRYDGVNHKLPFYEAYVLLHWRGREDAFKSEFSDDDIQTLPSFARRFGELGFDAWLRRKQRAALLQLAGSLGFRRLPLAGVNVIVSLADGSIRDFLEIMGEIFATYVAAHGWDQKDQSNLERFATSRTPIAIDIQTTGIYRASDAYVEGISHRSEIDADVITRLINGLGHYTSGLQAGGFDNRALASAERGIFFVDYSSLVGRDGLSPDGQFIESVIRQAELAGYLRPVEFRRTIRAAQSDSSSRSSVFRLHRRFSPHFRFSFRGAYEVVTLPPMEVLRLCASTSTITPRAWAEAVAGTAHALDDQLLLPLAEIARDE
jgi:hypothetical protein